MWPTVLLGGALGLGQPPAPPTPPPASQTSYPIPTAGDATPPAAAPATSTGAAPEQGAFMQLLQGTRYGAALDRAGVTVGGWTNSSFTASTARRDQLPMGFNYRANDFLLQQNWLRIDRPVDVDSDTPTFGFRSDWILPGSDYRFTLARGLWDGQSGRYGIDPVQFYGQAYLPNVGQGLDVKLGRFFAPFGVESIAAPDSSLPSRSYAFIYNPFTQTGLLTQLKLDDTWSVKNGIVMGNDVFIDPASSPYYVGGFRWAPPEGRSTAEFTTILGSGRFDTAEQFHNPQVFDLVLTRKLTDKLTWTLEGFYGFTRDVPNVGFANWFGVINYLTYELADNLAGTLRLEFFDDCQGQRTGSRGLYTAITGGMTYKPAPWLWLRPEVRYDHNSRSRPFDGRADVFTATMDVLVRW
ncbi:MAG: porin [Fimbriiglobus sp.]|jgi:hypothetical protein|nr:porin [Fimbriiglobus sp.]